MSKYSTSVLNTMDKLSNLTIAEPRPYALIHATDEKVSKHYVAAPYNPTVFFALVAYIQFECSELDMSYGMSQDEVIEVLEKFYNCSPSKKRLVGSEKIDLYYAWEAFCGDSDRVQAIEEFKRNGLRDYLQKFVDEFRNKDVI